MVWETYSNPNLGWGTWKGKKGKLYPLSSKMGLNRMSGEFPPEPKVAAHRGYTSPLMYIMFIWCLSGLFSRIVSSKYPITSPLVISSDLRLALTSNVKGWSYPSGDSGTQGFSNLPFIPLLCPQKLNTVAKQESHTAAGTCPTIASNTSLVIQVFLPKKLSLPYCQLLIIYPRAT